MASKTEVEVERAALLKVVRAAVRLKHSVQADRELNFALDRAAQQFDASVLKGELPEKASADVLAEVLGE